MGRSMNLMHPATLLLASLLCTSTFAATITWTGNVNSNWNNAGNWSPNQIPSTTDDVVLTGATNRPTNQDIANLTIQSLRFNSTTSTAITITGQKITLSGAGAGVAVDAGAGNHTISVVIQMSSNTTWDIAAGPTLTVTEAIVDGTPQLAGHWTFDESSGVTAFDSSGNQNNGNIVNNAARVAGQVGGALQFDGTSYVDVPSFTWAAPGDPVTVSYWINIATAEVQNSFAFGVGAGGANRFSAHSPWGDSVVYWDYGDINNNGRIQTPAAITSSLNKWTHVALVSAGKDTGFKAIYLDGTLVVSGTTNNFPTAALTGLIMGRSTEGTGNLMKGRLDDFRIYRGQLNLAQIGQLNSGATPTITGQSLIKSGAGTLVTTGTNGYSGGTTVNAGILQGNTRSLKGAINNNAAVTFSQTESGIYTGVISGPGIVGKSGDGIVTFTGSQAYSGATTISAGTLRIGANERLPDATSVNISTGATLDLNGFSETIGGLQGTGDVINGTASTLGTSTGTFAGGDINEGLDLDGSFLYAINFRGPGGLQVRDAVFTADNVGGLTLVAENEIIAWHTATYGTTRDDDNLETVMKSIRWTATNSTGIEIVGIDLANLVVGRRYSLQLLFAEESSDRGFNVSVEGAVIATSFSPRAIVGGVIDRTRGVVLRHTFVATDTTLNIVLNGVGATQPDKNPVIQGLTLEQTLASSTLTVNNSVDCTFAGVVREGQGTIALTKQGSAALTLSNGNLYSAGTIVSGGTLVCSNATGSATGTGSVALNAGTTLAGTGTLSGTVIATSATISPAGAASGFITLGGLTLDAASTINTQLGFAPDRVQVNGNLTLDGSLNVTPATGFAAGVYTVVNYTGTLVNNTLALATTPPGYTSAITVGAGAVNVVFSATTNMTLTSNPSPSVYGAPISIDALIVVPPPATGFVTGQVAFTVDGTVQAPVTISSGIASLVVNGLSVGTHAFAATFPGSTTLITTNGNISHTVLQAQSSTQISSSASPSPNGQVTLTATVLPVAPSILTPQGSVRFTIDGVVQAPIALVNGAAALDVSLAPGAHTVLAAYLGTTEFAASNATFTQGVQPSFQSPPTLTPSPAVMNQPISGTVTASNATITWNWGDGTPSVTGNAPTHTYTTPGIYTVTVTATTVDGLALTSTLTLFVGTTIGGGVSEPGIPGVVVTASAGGTGKIICNYARRSKTSYQGSVKNISLPATLMQADLANLPATLTLGTGAKSATFRFDISAKGSGRATGLPQIKFDVKRKSFKFKAQREDLTDLTEALGGPQQFNAPKGQKIQLYVPATLQIGTKIYLAVTFKVNYGQISPTGGSGKLAP